LAGEIDFSSGWVRFKSHFKSPRFIRKDLRNGEFRYRRSRAIMRRVFVLGVSVLLTRL